MSSANLEHVNVTVSDPAKTADMLCDLFDWHIRWSGDSINGGRTIHVGTKGSYVALNPPVKATKDSGIRATRPPSLFRSEVPVRCITAVTAINNTAW